MSSKVAIGTSPGCNVGKAMVGCASIVAQKGDSLAGVSPRSGDNQSHDNLVRSRTCTFGYVVERLIGKGQYGQAFQARPKSGHNVAITHMPHKPGAKLTLMHRRAVDVLVKFHGHPHVVKLQEST